MRIRDATKRSSDAASGWNPSANDDEDELVLLLQLMRMSTCTGSGAERSIMACAQDIERPGLITDQSSRRPSAAERQCRQTWVIAIQFGRLEAGDNDDDDDGAWLVRLI